MSHHGKTPPCADAIIRSGIARVVSALEDPNPEVAGQGHERMRAKGIAVEVGLCADEARRDHAGHITRMTQGRPHVTLKLAVSADGKAGLPGRKPVAITGETARDRVFQMRAASDAIMVGIGTVLADDPQLTCRLPGMFERSPVRVVLDEKLVLPLSTSVVATVARDADLGVYVPQAVADCRRDSAGKGLQGFPRRRKRRPARLAQVLKALAEQGITRLMVEGGPILAASFVEADLVDEAVAVACASNRSAPAASMRWKACRSTALTGRLTFTAEARKLDVDTIEIFVRV